MTWDMGASIEGFLAARRFAVVGASNDRAKFGHKVFAACIEHGLAVDPVNPNERTILGRRCFPSLSELPERAESISIVTPPDVTEQIVEEAAAAGARSVWMQPGAESERAIERAGALGLAVIARGPCLLVELVARQA
jgi:predicted CoA-binding protein